MAARSSWWERGPTGSTADSWCTVWRPVRRRRRMARLASRCAAWMRAARRTTSSPAGVPRPGIPAPAGAASRPPAAGSRRRPPSARSTRPAARRRPSPAPLRWRAPSPGPTPVGPAAAGGRWARGSPRPRPLLGRGAVFVGRLAYFFGHAREAPAVLAGARRLDRGVQSEQVRLRRDALDEIDEVVDRGGELGELRDPPRAGLDHFPHVEQPPAGGGHVAAVPFGHAADLLAELGGALGRVRHVPRRLAQLVESRAHGAERGPLLIRAARNLDHRRQIGR